MYENLFYRSNKVDRILLRFDIFDSKTIASLKKVKLVPKLSLKIKTANAIFWIYLVFIGVMLLSQFGCSHFSSIPTEI